MKLIDRGHEPDLAQQEADARLAFECMTNGGVSVLPLSVSYAIFAHTAEGVERIYKLKQRPMTKPNGVIGSWDIFREVFNVGKRELDLVRCLTIDHNLPLSVVAPFNPAHDWLKTVKLEDVQTELKEGCDLVLGYGTSRYDNEFGMGSTIVELPSWKILRWGGCFEAQAKIVEKEFGVSWPERPREGSWTLV